MGQMNAQPEKVLTQEDVDRIAKGKRDEITSFAIPEGVTSIGEKAFYGCSSLINVTIPDSVTSIEKTAFCHCKSLMYMELPASVEKIGDWAFLDCPLLKLKTEPDSYADKWIQEQQKKPQELILFPERGLPKASIPLRNSSNFQMIYAFRDDCLIWNEYGESFLHPVEEQERIILVRYPFYGVVGETFHAVYRTKNSENVPDISNRFHLIEAVLLKILDYQSFMATVLVRVLKVHHMLDYLNTENDQTKIEFSAAEENMTPEENLTLGLGDSFDDHGWTEKEFSIPFEFGREDFIYTDNYGIDHCLFSNDWTVWEDEEPVLWGDHVLGNHEYRLRELRSRRLIHAETSGKITYEKLYPDYYSTEGKTFLLLLEYTTYEVFPDIDQEVKNTFREWKPKVTYIGNNVIQSENLQALILPRSVERIYDLAFVGCPNLRYIIVPDDCNFRFQKWAFKGCAENLTFSVVTGSPVIPALKRFGFRVEERPAGTMETTVQRKNRVLMPDIKKIEESPEYHNLLPDYTFHV